MAIALAGNRGGVRVNTSWVPWTALGVVVLLFAAYVGKDQLGHLSKGGGQPQALPPGEDKPRSEASKKTTCTLSAEKFEAAKIALEPARTEGLQTEVGVPGHVTANLNQQIDIRPRATGVIREVKVMQGEQVKRGQVLAVLDSPDVGLSRLNLRARQRDLEAARIEADWKDEVAKNVALLIPEMRTALTERRRALPDDDEHVEISWPKIAKLTDTRMIERQFAGKQLGTYRGTLLQAYADFDIACHEEQKTASPKGVNVMGEHIPLVARHTREGVQAKLEAAMEQSLFDAQLEKKLADNRLRQAEGAVLDAAHRLALLGVDVDLEHVLSREASRDLSKPDGELDVTTYPIKAAFDSTVVKRTAAAVTSFKVDVTDVLFTLVDLSSVWVTANVPEPDVAKLSSIRNGTIEMTAQAYPGRIFKARLLSVGAIVDPQTRSVPILAQTDNRDGVLIAGMFTRIILDSKAREEALTVPAAAVVDIDAQSCVFVPASTAPGNRSFSIRPVETGRQLGDRIVIKAGIRPGDVVVSSGAFMLKSELVLQNEPEEE